MRGLTAFLLIATAISFCIAADWPQWRGASLDGKSPEKDFLTTFPKEGPRKLWSAKVGTGYAGISVADGRAYTMGNDGKKDTIWCLDAVTGKEIWKYSYASPAGGGGYGGPRTAPTIDGKRLYTLGNGGLLLCLDSEKGDVLWSVDTARTLDLLMPFHGLSCHPVIVGDKVIVETGSKKGSLVAFDKTSGKVLWQSLKDRVGYGTPLSHKLKDAQRLAVLTGEALVGIDAQTGKELWRYPWKVAHQCSINMPVDCGDGRLLVTSGYGMGAVMLQIDAGNKVAQVWKQAEMSAHYNTPVLHDGLIYGFDGAPDSKTLDAKAMLRCLDAATGQIKWSAGKMGKGSLLIAGGQLIILSEQGELIIAPAGGKEFAPAARAGIIKGACWSVPTLAGGLLYARTVQGDLVCVDLRSGDAQPAAARLIAD